MKIKVLQKKKITDLLRKAKACPFCGYKGYIKLRFQFCDTDIYCVCCDKCGARGPRSRFSHYITEEQAFSSALFRWNKRKEIK